MAVRTCRLLAVRLNLASSMHWLRSWKHANAHFVRKIKQRKPLHLRLRESNEKNRMRRNSQGFFLSISGARDKAAGPFAALIWLSPSRQPQLSKYWSRSTRPLGIKRAREERRFSEISTVKRLRKR